MLKHLVIAGLHGSGWVALRRLRTRRRFRVVTYHGVDERDDPVLNFDRLQTPPSRFRAQLERLAREYRMVDLQAAVRQWQDGGEWPDRGLAITFDDGYLNNVEVAAPILRHMGLPATFFVTAGYVEGRVEPWWYQLRRFLAGSTGRAMPPALEARRLESEWRLLPDSERRRRFQSLGASNPPPAPCYPFMRESDLRRLVEWGFDVQPHGDLHLSFLAETASRLAEEVAESAAFIRRATGRAPWGYAYPYGHEPSDPAVADRLFADHGLRVAVGTREGCNGPGAPRWALRRWDLHGGYTPAAASLRVAGGAA